MEYLTTIEMAERWGITPRRIAILCEQGRIEGAVKKGKTWLIPYDSEKPEDARKNSNSNQGLNVALLDLGTDTEQASSPDVKSPELVKKEEKRSVKGLFASILDVREVPDQERNYQAFYQDLNLDQIIDRICLVWGEDVSSFYGYFPADEACEDYRREVLGDVKLEGVYEALREFAEKMKARREVFVKKEEVSQSLQKAVWHIREVHDYCSAFMELYEALRAVPFRSNGMRVFLQYLGKYLSEDSVCSMQKEAAGLLEEMDAFRLVLTYENDRFYVEPGEVPGTYEAFLESCFPGQGKRMGSPFEAVPELVELEQELLKVFRKKNPDFFVRAEAFYKKYEIYAEDVLLRFASEIKYYLSFYCFEKRMVELGFRFCVPGKLSGHGGGKRMYARGLYDLALACANSGRAEDVISNDMEYRAGERFFVLTGPNQGGKTTFARSLGQMVYLAKMGLDVPAECAVLYHFSSLLTHFSVEESAETGRGKLMDELIRLVPIMDASREGNFVVVNELFTTAANYDACIMGKRVLGHLLGQGCMGIYVTHLAELGEERPGVVSLRAMLDGRGERSFKIERNRAVDNAGAESQAIKFGLTYGQLKERLK